MALIFLALAFVAFLVFFITYMMERFAKDHIRPKVTLIKWLTLILCGVFLFMAVYGIIQAKPLGL